MPSFRAAREVVETLGAVQAQDYAGAKWALGQRIRGAVDADIETAMSDGSILRTHVLRPTWHFVAPGDIRWMLALTAPRVKAAMAYYNRTLDLDDAVFQRSNAAIERALRGGKQLTRPELSQAIRGAGIEPAGSQRLGHLLMNAELDALICSGPRRGKQFTYMLVDERVPSASSIDRDDALARLARTYFSTRGPATAQDFSWWSGLTVTDARRAIEIAHKDLEETTIDGRPNWAGGASTGSRKATLVHLLPNYDELFIGFRDRSAFGERLKAAKAKFPADALFAHILFVNGQIVGGWKRAVLKEEVSVRVRLLTRLTGAERAALVAATERYGDFLGTPTSLSYHQ